ncbi:uncharacterized protein [Littorina saxatilis]|uniref:uncharacterized protein n=1 Tax=Littorina saxatilis TaxID=31220 RepID=UPI0038B4F852
MGGTTGLFLFAVLCLCLQLYSCARIAGRCTLGGRYNEVKTLIKRNGYPRSTRIQLPCRYRMLNVRCNGVATEVFADNSYDSVEDSPYATGVFANITTVNDDGSVTFQQLFLNNVTFKAYLDEGNLTRSPWQWTYTGSVVDDDKKIVGAYDATTKRGVLTSSGITVTFLYVGPTRFRRFVKESTLTIAMKCDEDTFSSVGNGYPQSVCGSPNNTYEVMEATQKELKLDFHHRVRELGYLLFGKQNAKQPDPVCQEAVDIGGACPDLGERMYACKNLYNARIICLRNNNMNPLKLYVTCMRILCNTDKARSNDTCSTLREAISACGPFDNHVNIVELNSRAGCPAPAALPPPETTTQSYWYNRNGGPQSECVDKDRAFSTRYGHESRTTSAVDTFFTRQMTFELPCR